MTSRYIYIEDYHSLGLYIRKILTNREMVNFQKLDFLRFFFINFVATGLGAREWNGVSQTGQDPIIQSAKCESPR